MKKLFSVVFLIFSISSFCSSVTNIALTGSFADISYAALFNNPSYSFESFPSPNDAVRSFSQGETDAIILSVPAALRLTSLSSGEVELLAVTQEQDLYCVTSVATCKDITDLLGKKVCISKGGLQEPFVTYVFEKCDLPLVIGRGGVTPSWENNSSLSVGKLIDGSLSYAVLSEPFVSTLTKHPKFHIAVDFKKEFESIAGKKEIVPKCILVCRKSYIKENPEGYSSFLSDMEKSAAFIEKNPVLASNLCVKYSNVNKSAALSKSVKNAKFTFVPYREAEKGLSSLVEIYNKKSKDKLLLPSVSNSLPK